MCHITTEMLEQAPFQIISHNFIHNWPPPLPRQKENKIDKIFIDFINFQKVSYGWMIQTFVWLEFYERLYITSRKMTEGRIFSNTHTSCQMSRISKVETSDWQSVFSTSSCARSQETSADFYFPIRIALRGFLFFLFPVD